MEKQSARKRARLKIMAIPPETRGEFSASIRDAVRALPEWRRARHVVLFSPLSDEPDVAPLADAWGKSFYLPRVAGEGMRIHRFGGRLERSQLGVMEPTDNEDKTTPPDLILVPGMAFSGDGTRLGRGRGFYDRYLQSLATTTTRVGIAFQCQIAESLPREPHDETMHLVVTEQGVIRPAR